MEAIRRNSFTLMMWVGCAIVSGVIAGLAPTAGGWVPAIVVAALVAFITLPALKEEWK